MDHSQLKIERAKKLHSLRLNANQTAAWQTQLLGLVEEISRENLQLRAGHAQLKNEIEDLKQERIAV